MNQSPIIASSNSSKKVSRAVKFVDYVIDRIDKDNGFAARLKRADNPATEYQSWELLANFGIDLENEWERLPYCTIGAALARCKPNKDGKLAMGSAIAACFDESSKKGNASDQAKARLRRLLACTTTTEVCRITRPLLMLMANRGVTPDFSQLLEQLLWYSSNGQNRIRTAWAQEFYRRKVDEGDNETVVTHD